jgi:hypothetical protein
MFGASQIGDDLKWNDALNVHRPVEKFFLDVMQSYPTKPCFDRTCQEPIQFWSINYSLYAGFFSMAPLQNEMRRYQIQEALCSGTPDGFDYAEYFAINALDGGANKYAGRKVFSDMKHKCLAVLTGSNCISKTVDIAKLRWIVEEYGSLAAIKPHPLTTENDLLMIKSLLLPNANVLHPDEDVYGIMQQVNTVYTTHSSETALYAACSGKAVRPLSMFGNRMEGSFAHISEHLFSTLSPKISVNKIFSDARAGMVHPEIHNDWQDRIVLYLEYIHKIRHQMKNAYK